MSQTLFSRFRAGDQIGHYTVQHVTTLPEIAAELTLLRHQNGAHHAHIARADDNKGFGVTFPTVPKDSTGIAHILEHNVLMGSRRFPVSDPFFSMLPRSLNTFMNAMTGGDWTTYPYSTRNKQDYFNLLSVYLDATFFPLLRPESFWQDGHRFQFADPKDPTSELQLQGVVYNEMKGAMASPASVLWNAFGEALYPDLTYANNSGGKPSDIPTLTHEQLLAFHAAHYHPSNAYFYTYGDLNLEEVLEKIEEQVMAHFEPATLDVSIPLQDNFSAPQTKEVAYPSGDQTRGAQVVLGWKLGLLSEDQELRWHILSDILLGNAGAPLTRPLIESGLGGALSDVVGYLDNFREPAFAVGLKGLSADKANAAEQLILNTLQDIYEKGVAPDLIESSLYQVELSTREVSNAGWPYALKLMFTILRPWMNGENPETALTLLPRLERLREELKERPVFEEMLRDLLANPHRVTLLLSPDPELAARTEQDERDLVTRLSASFGEKEKADIVALSEKLEQSQAAENDYSVLPSLALSDIPTTVPRPEYHTEQAGALEVVRIPQPTGGLSYLSLQLELPELPDHLRDVLPLYAYALSRSGAANRDYAEFARAVDAVGSLNAWVDVSVAKNNLDTVSVHLNLNGKCLSRKVDVLISLMSDALYQPRFQRERLRQLLEQRLASLVASVVSSGNAYASSVASAPLSRAEALEETFSGLHSLTYLKKILANEKGLDDLLAHFEELQKFIAGAGGSVCLTAEEQDLTTDLGALTAQKLIANHSDTAPRWNEIALPALTPKAHLTDTPVFFNALAYRTVPLNHPDNPVLLVLAGLLKPRYLLPEIREKGGAYGAAAHFSPRTGIFTLSSYRDPHTARTYEIFTSIGKWLTELEPQILTEAILAASKGLDPLPSPETVGRARYLNDRRGWSAEEQEEYRARLLQVTSADLRRVLDHYFRPEVASYALVGGKDPSSETAHLGLEWDVTTV